MARDRTPRDAFGRPLEPDAGTTGAPRRAGGTSAGARPSGTGWADTPRPGSAARPAGAPGATPAPAERERRWELPSGAPDGPPPQPPAATQQTNPLATVAFVAGVLSVCVLPVILSVAAIVIGGRALRLADLIPGAPGRTLARTGRVLGWISLVLWLLVPLLAIVLVATSTR